MNRADRIEKAATELKDIRQELNTLAGQEKLAVALAALAPFGLLILGVVAVAVLAGKRTADKPRAADSDSPPPPPPGTPPAEPRIEESPEPPPAPAPSPEPTIADAPQAAPAG